MEKTTTKMTNDIKVCFYGHTEKAMYDQYFELVIEQHSLPYPLHS